MPVTTGMPSLNNFDLDNIKSREELLDALYAVLEEIRHIDDTIGEDNLTEELLNKINAGVEAANSIRNSKNDSAAGQPWQIYSSLSETGVLDYSGTIGIFLRNMPENRIISWTHSDDHSIKIIGAPSVPEPYGIITAMKGSNLNIKVAIFYGRSGNVYYIKYGNDSTYHMYDPDYPEYVGVWRRMPISASEITISGVDSAQTLQSSTTIVNLDSSNKVEVDTQFLTPVTKGIQCNRAGFVEISAALQANGVTAGDRLIMDINVGQSSALSVSVRTTRWDAPATHVTGMIPPFLCAVNEGDIVFLYAYNNNGGGNIPTGNQTYLTVRYV